MKAFVVLPLILLCSACAKQHVRPADSTRSVGLEMILPAGSPRMALQSNQVFTVATELESELPEYPELAALLRRPQTNICVELVVSETGEVLSVTQIRPEDDCEEIDSPASAKFLPNVRTALLNWQYLAAGICEFEHDESECAGDEAISRRVAIKLAYRLLFTQQGQVSANRLKRQ